MESKNQSRRNFLKGAITALAGTGLNGLLTNESEAHPPSIAGQRNYFSTPLYFGPHPSHNYHFYSHPINNNVSPYAGLYIMDASLRAMFWGNLIRQQAVLEERLRTQNPNINPSDCRIRIEEPMNLPQTFIANCYQDSNRNGYVDFPEEFIGIGKTRFDPNESIAIGIRLPFGRMGKNRKIATKVYKELSNGDKKLVDKNETIMDYDNVWRNFRNGKLAANSGLGNYEAEFYFENDEGKLRHWNTISFSIISRNSYGEPKVIVEPLGVFREAPKPK